MEATVAMLHCLLLILLLFLAVVIHTKEEPYCEKRSVDDGEWHSDWCEGDLQLGSERCNIEVRDSCDLTQEQFLEEYARRKTVIIRHPRDNDLFRDGCKRHNLLKNYGSKIIRLSSANTYSYKKVDTTLEHYINHLLNVQPSDTLGNETWYWFGDNNHTEWEGLFSLYQLPAFHLPGHEPAMSFGLAASGTGVPFHFHGPGFAEVIFGRKRWFLYPPDHVPAWDPDKSTRSWLEEEYPNLSEDSKPLECTLRPGELIYFPDRWWHATLNTQTSVFVSTFLSP
ncbi:PREDICTED: jmjC domain-containing protein 8-like [Priapulus caudatus]|uniref:JmjC domain-containing protein 8-like n=1 Tax=Priapulus caudatus TaxID=37621 RepID=A0ABM1DU99_PRICU|nr:PREDICTED: jmjC domain-containing protein 8-like [Priapulus caudatus]